MRALSPTVIIELTLATSAVVLFAYLLIKKLIVRRDPLSQVKAHLKRAGFPAGFDPADPGSEPAPAPRSMHSSQVGLSAETTFLPDAFDEGFNGRFCKDGEDDKTVRLLTTDADEKVKGLLVDGWRFIAVDPITRPPVMASGVSRVYKAIKPQKAVLTELVSATFRAKGLPNKTIAAIVENAEDVVLTSAFSGADNCFPNAPTVANGIAGPTFSPAAIGVGISWPTINAGIDFTAMFALERSVLSRVPPPPGYDPVPVSLKATVRLMLLGPSLR